MTARRESGQTLAINIFFLIVLIGIAGLVVDGGHLLVQKRSAQGSADAAALAGVLEVTRSRASAEAVASDYVGRNGTANLVNQVTATGGSTSSCGSRPLPRYSVCVRVGRQQPTFLAQVVGVENTNATARAIASASQVQSIAGWLPVAVREGMWTSGTQLSISPNDPGAVGGAINTPAGTSCSFSGGSVIGQVIRGQNFGGLDACPVQIGQTIQTQTGVQNSQWTNQGFDPRLGSDTDRFEDVFQFDPNSGKYIVLKPDSPRVGVIPIVSSESAWPLSGDASIRVVSYAIVYIGKRDNPNILAPYTGQGNNQQNQLRVWLTPVEAILPEDWEVALSEYDPLNPSIVVYRLVE